VGAKITFYPTAHVPRLDRGIQPCIQLRVKNLSAPALEQEIKQSLHYAAQAGALLFINDYWELAIALGAKAVHLGQEDIEQADIDKIREAGLYLGVSTHCYYEVARAHALNPSYMACGPIYETTSKIMRFHPQGLDQLYRFQRTLSYPLVAIGGITLERLPQVVKMGVEGVAVISAITQAKDPEQALQQFLEKMHDPVAR
jgi:hydroxymethylpyrimidine kinase / phosphomethylpyrimidine kinase / thiamine-phosphate diphosphorylase